MSGPLRPFLTVLIPAYNEAEGLAGCVEAVWSKLIELGVEAEILIVNDASRDNTGAIADDLAAGNPNVRVVHHAANRGIGGGFDTGRHQARGEWMMMVPADLAMDLDDFGKYLEAARQADLVVGVSPKREDYTPYRNLVSWMNIRLIQHLFGIRLRQFNYINMYRLHQLRTLKVGSWNSAFFFAEIAIQMRDAGGRLVEVGARYVPRKSGRPTGARPRFIAHTVFDMLRFWLAWSRGRLRNRLVKLAQAARL